MDFLTVELCKRYERKIFGPEQELFPQAFCDHYWQDKFAMIERLRPFLNDVWETMFFLRYKERKPNPVIRAKPKNAIKEADTYVKEETIEHQAPDEDSNDTEKEDYGDSEKDEITDQSSEDSDSDKGDDPMGGEDCTNPQTKRRTMG
ncbi:MAG: hypothetical protein Q9227_005154 [Pyrenula ochraceoflavens]